MTLAACDSANDEYFAWFKCKLKHSVHLPMVKCNETSCLTSNSCIRLAIRLFSVEAINVMISGDFRFNCIISSLSKIKRYDFHAALWLLCWRTFFFLSASRNHSELRIEWISGQKVCIASKSSGIDCKHRTDFIVHMWSLAICRSLDSLISSHRIRMPRHFKIGCSQYRHCTFFFFVWSKTFCRRHSHMI